MTWKNVLISLILVLPCFICSNILAQNFWYKLANVDSVRIYSVKVNSSGDIFATVIHQYPSVEHGGIIRSLDHGLTWQELGPCQLTEGGFDFDTYGNIYIEGNDTIFKSADNGDSWFPVFPGGGILFGYTMKTGYDSIVFLGGVSSGAIVRSGDYGATWRVVQTFPGGSWQWVTDFLFSTEGIIYATTVHAEYGDPTLFKSIDLGNTWTPITTWGNGYEYTYSAAEDLQGYILLGSSENGLLRFYDTNPPIFKQLTPGTIVHGIIVNSDNKYYLATSNEGGPGYGGCIIFDANDSSWIQQNSGMNNTFSHGITVDETGHLLLWGDGGIYRSNDAIITGYNPQKKLPGSGYSIYPNPCNNYVVITSNNPLSQNEFSQITILGNDGKILFQDSGHFAFPMKLNLDGFPKGLLCISISSGRHHNTYKILHY